jgi:hypothetical protein
MRLNTRTATVLATMMGALSSVLRAASRGTEPISSKPQPRPLWGKQSLIEEMFPSAQRPCSWRGAGIEMSDN